jgi:hypothetical protein
LRRRAVDAFRCRRFVVAFRCRRAVVAAGDYVRFRSLRFAPTHIHRPYSRRYRVGCNVAAYSRRYRVGCNVAAYSRRYRVGFDVAANIVFAEVSIK